MKRTKKEILMEEEEILRKNIALDISKSKVDFFNSIKENSKNIMLRDGKIPDTIYGLRINKDILLIDNLGLDLNEAAKKMFDSADDIMTFGFVRMEGIKIMEKEKLRVENSIVIHVTNCLGDYMMYVLKIEKDPKSKKITLNDKALYAEIINKIGWKNIHKDGVDILKSHELNSFINFYTSIERKKII